MNETTFQAKDIAEYYNTTHIHYEQWWDIKRSHSLHYGIWDTSTRNFREAIFNTNRIMMETAGIKDNERILDAGCGVGGAAIFVSERKKVKVTGITLSERQVGFARLWQLKKD
ncbi:MAG: class I SAM-dependent methyltransferase [Flavobacteriales bacterium]|nr:class I SAM-dependent methyltransferase [Flavobacteriales bacterium]MCB9447468.1 class I SAM-dependent methyltransferase [Flavobacteriales bacterium]